MKKVCILYYSGTGNTKTISEKIYANINGHFETEIFSIENIEKSFSLDKYDALIIGFPVVHSAPPKRMLYFISSLIKQNKKIYAFVFSSCALYSANSLRIFSKLLAEKNIIPFMQRSYNRCPASDGSLLLPFIKSFFVFHKSVQTKIEKDANNFTSEVQKGDMKKNMPSFNLYGILNYPNKLAGSLFAFNIYTHKDECIKCGKCISQCPPKAISQNDESYPVFNKHKCEKCFRCIHFCQNHALSLFKNKTHKKLFID